MPTEQDPATSHASPGGVEDDEISSPESSAGGSRRTSPKKTTLKPQSKLDCRGKKCKLPRMTDKEFSRRDKSLRFINTDGKLTKTYSRDRTMIPYIHKGYLNTIQKIKNNNGKRKATIASQKKKFADLKETRKVRKQVNKARKRLDKTSPRILLSDRQALQKWRHTTTKLENALKIRFLVPKEELERIFKGSGSGGSVAGRSQAPRSQAKQLYLTRFGAVSLVETRGCRKNPTSDKAYLKLLSELSGSERAIWGLKPKMMLH
ncbi:hypothetical protein BASA50_006177 [Batrachochytrium salamandrivorans]|uniref:Uncharacterized protein n=1 Tax=Batrachochytrium salamandrivorans TaxID=1357716 RepID=A0ABQ8FAN7_9FUNG|nr:hypothetical protein BASA50_006177 [Batrachochytrium salamandrivorans]